MLFLLGIPLMFLELAFGQYAALGPAAIFERFCQLSFHVRDVVHFDAISGIVDLHCLNFLFM
jgi:SNF family Na+-dependent transporter